MEPASIDDYIREDENLKSLHKDIRSCDEILEQMENMLGGYTAAANAALGPHDCRFDELARPLSVVADTDRSPIDGNVKMNNHEQIPARPL
eukprot:SAG11_NODE_8738_length_981_cov_0.874150_1_plen_90_part_10